MSERLLITSNQDHFFTWMYPPALKELKLSHSLSFFVYLTSGDDGDILSVGDVCDNVFCCTNGHELSKEKGVPSDYASLPEAGARGQDIVVHCDLCKRNQINLDRYLHHCAECRYDSPFHSLLYPP